MADITPKLSRSVDVVTTDHEVLLWRLGVLSLTDSVGLSRAVYFYFCKAFGVYTRHSVREVIREQFRLGEDEFGRFVEFVDFERPECRLEEMASAVGTVSDAVLQPARRVVQYDDPANDYSVYKIMAAYMAHIPASGDFFRRPRAGRVKQGPTVQFASRSLGMNLLSQYLPDMMRAAGFVRGHFTSQSIKVAVVTTLFRLGVDADITQQRTRWWGDRGRVKPGPRRGGQQPGAGPSGSGQAAMSGPATAAHREKLVAVSRILDPPPFTPLDRAEREVVLRGVREAQLALPERLPSADPAAVDSPNDDDDDNDDNEPLLQPEPVDVASNDFPEQGGHHLAPYQWYSETLACDAQPGAEEQSPDVVVHEAKRPRPPVPQTQTRPPAPALMGAGGALPGVGFSAAPGASGDSCLVVPKELTHVEEDDEEDDCVVVSSISDASSVMEQSRPTSSTTASIHRHPIPSSSSVVEPQQRHIHPKHHQQQHHTQVPDQTPKNQMQCLSHAEAREAASRPPGPGTSALCVAFKYTYEIDHNGEVAASREVRALHTTARDGGGRGEPSGPGPVKRRLLPVNVVDSAGREATERQEELPNFAIRLSDFFASLSPIQRRLDIRDVVIRGSRGQGTDRLNVELVLAENEGTGAERGSLSDQPSDFLY